MSSHGGKGGGGGGTSQNKRSNNKGGRGRGRGGGRKSNIPTTQNRPATTTITITKHLLVLHGSRQTGQLLVGRMDKLRKKLAKKGIGMVAPDAPFPHPEDAEMRQWWNRENSTYHGLEQSLDTLQTLWKEHSFIGALGFSMGARMAHLLVQVHETPSSGYNFDGLGFVIMAAGYEAPIPTNMIGRISPSSKLKTPSLHVFGSADKLIASPLSRAAMQQYENALQHEHDGGHHVPMRAANVEAYLNFIDDALAMMGTMNGGVQPADDDGNTPSNHTPRSSPPPQAENSLPTSSVVTSKPIPLPSSETPMTVEPDDEAAEAQRDEVDALTAIFPDEFTLTSKVYGSDDDPIYTHPISYNISLSKQEEDDKTAWWPPHPIKLNVTYPPTYPTEAMPAIRLLHDNNMMEFSSGQMQALQETMREVAEAELGMPSVLSCVYAAREFFESGDAGTIAPDYKIATGASAEGAVAEEQPNTDDMTESTTTLLSSICRASKERIQQCNLEGLEIAKTLLTANKVTAMPQHDEKVNEIGMDGSGLSSGKGGSWQYSIGLVGKPSAGKSTFFNSATAFARQRDDSDNVIGGATMAPHPFTTIDPNVGFCLVPAPPGSCPEDDPGSSLTSKVGCTHGRDAKGRRFLPVMLKDVAGLVPGAYQGRGRGNKFLNDLTDATVLVHVVDASGTADTEGNSVGDANAGGSHPLNDLAWIRNELIEWVFTNLMFKWDGIKRKGRHKLAGMFSGYGQTQALLYGVLLSVEKYMDRELGRDHALDHLDDWDEGDVHRLVSAFLGVRFPMALALNKKDLPTAAEFITDVQEALPAHGALVGVPLAAKSEMSFVRSHLETADSCVAGTTSRPEPPVGVWECLQAAVMLREPVLVFPVIDMTTYEPLPGLRKYAVEDASLPNAGMISCLVAAGGSGPTSWNGEAYDSKKGRDAVLRDVLVMKPGSTVEDVFLTLKNKGALGGEFVRAEGAGCLGEKAKLIPKQEIITREKRILKIMTNKRREWQSKLHG